MTAKTLDEAIIEWRAEMFKYLQEMQNFSNVEIETVLRKMSAWSARIAWIRMSIVRSPEKRAQLFRTQEVDPFVAEIDRQRALWSRVIAIKEAEIKALTNRGA